MTSFCNYCNEPFETNDYWPHDKGFCSESCAQEGGNMRPFDSKEEAYHAGLADGLEQGKKEAETERKHQDITSYNDGYDQGTDQGEQQRHELKEEIEGLKNEIALLEEEVLQSRLQKDGECGCEQYSLCWSSNHKPFSKED